MFGNRMFHSRLFNHRYILTPDDKVFLWMPEHRQWVHLEYSVPSAVRKFTLIANNVIWKVAYHD